MRRFLTKIVQASPSLPYMALGLWLAWCYIAYFGTAWLSNTEIDGRNISSLFLLSTLSFALVFLGATFLPSRLRTTILKLKFVIAGGVVASLACLGIIIIGPYYLGSVLPVEVVRIVFYGECIMTGLGTALIALKCGEMYGSLRPRQAILYVALSYMLAAVIYFIIIGTPVWQPVAGGPSLMGILSFVTIPLLASLTATLSSLDHNEDKLVYEESRSSFPRSFWNLVAVTFVFSLTVSSLRSASVELSPVDVTFESSSLVMLLRMLMALAFAGAAIGLDGERFNFGKIYSVIMTFVVILIAITPTVGLMHVGWSQVVTFLSYVYEFVLWCLLAFIVYQKRISAVLVFGFGYGVFMLGNGVGWLMGVHVLPALMVSPYSFAVLFSSMAIVLVCAFVLFSEKELDNLFMPNKASEASLDLLLGEGLSDRNKEGEFSEKKGRFTLSIEEVSERGKLSQRETDVLRCLAMGYESAAIAKKLGVSWNTVRTHTRNVYTKLDLHSRQELIELVDEVARQVE